MEEAGQAEKVYLLLLFEFQNKGSHQGFMKTLAYAADLPLNKSDKMKNIFSNIFQVSNYDFTMKDLIKFCETEFSCGFERFFFLQQKISSLPSLSGFVLT